MCNIKTVLKPGTRWHTFGTHRGKLTQSYWLTIQKPDKKAPDMIQVQPSDHNTIPTPWPKTEDILQVRPDFIQYKLKQTNGERTQTITVTWEKDDPTRIIEDIPQPLPYEFKATDEYVKSPIELCPTNTSIKHYISFERTGITPPFTPSRAVYRKTTLANDNLYYVYEAGRLWHRQEWQEFYKQYGCTPAEALARQTALKE